jgi:uncharacterized coiled-coil DUF342 family protein
MNLQERRDKLAKQLEEAHEQREKLREAFMERTSLIDQLKGAVWALDQLLAEVSDDGQPDSSRADLETGEPVGHQSTNSDVAQ